MTRLRRKPPSVRKVRIRKGNHPMNPYPVPQEKLEDREGWPFAAPRAPKAKTDLSDEAQLGPDGEPAYMLRASHPLSGMVMRFMANASVELGILPAEREKMRKTALAMDEWRRNRGGCP